MHEQDHYDSKFECGCWTNLTGSFICAQHIVEFTNMTAWLSSKVKSFQVIRPNPSAAPPEEDSNSAAYLLGSPESVKLELEETEKDFEQALEILRKYGQHRPGCNWLIDFYLGKILDCRPCTCGYDRAMKEGILAPSPPLRRE